jgi:2-iminobutanoate/2-iminopropanoate deaminase
MINIIIIALSAALVSCSAVRTPMIRTFSAPDAAQPIGPYSHGVECSGRMIFMSGQIPLRADGTMVDGSVQDQTKQVFANIRTVLASQGATLSNVVKTTVFLQSMNDFAGMNEVYELEMGDHRPARSAVEVAKLPKNALVEIEVIACMP